MNGQERNMVGENGYTAEGMEGVPLQPAMPMNQQQAMMNANTSFTVGVVNPLNGALEAPEEFEDDEEEEVVVKSDAELALEARNKSGLRFILIFGLLVLIFIIMLPVIITLF